MAGKKQKKNKGSADNSVKKRKREDEAQGKEEKMGVEPEKKKPKKRKSKGGEGATAAEVAKPAATPTPEKQSESKSEEGPAAPTNQSSASTKKDKKPKRRSNADAAQKTPIPGQDSNNLDPQPRTPAAETSTNVFRGEKKKIKKSKQPVGSATTSPNANTPSAHGQPKADHQLSTVSPTAVSDDILETHSPFVQQTASFYLALSPCANDFPLEGLCAEHISPVLLTYYPPLKGIVLSYENARLSESPEEAARAHATSSKEASTVLAKSIDEYAVTYVWLTADFILFRPHQGSYLEGHVNLQNESLLGMVCYNYFNAGIEWNQLPKDWRWVSDEGGALDVGMSRGKGKKAAQEGEGHWVDAEGNKVEGRLVFRVRDFEATPGSDSGAGSINIYGSLLSEADERALEVAQKQR